MAVAIAVLCACTFSSFLYSHNKKNPKLYSPPFLHSQVYIHKKKERKLFRDLEFEKEEKKKK